MVHESVVGPGRSISYVLFAHVLFLSGLEKEKGVFRQRGLFRKVRFLEILEKEILENPQTAEKKEEATIL